MPDLLSLDPVPVLLSRCGAELSAAFDFSRPIRLSRAPGRLDVMGGIADYTGSMVCEMTLDRAAAVALQPRADRDVQVFSFNLFDEHKPFTFRIPLDAIAAASLDDLRREFAEPGRAWAGYLAGCLYILQAHDLIDLKNPSITGINLALHSTVPLGAGVSSSAAIEVATMMNLLDHFQIRRRVDPMKLAVMCQEVENKIVGAPCGIMDQASSCAGRSGSLMRMICQPHELLDPLVPPSHMRFLGINSNVKHSVGGGQYGLTRCAAFMAHKIILEQMRKMGEQAGRTLVADPMKGYLANLDPDDYKRFFRPILPDRITGRDFLSRFGQTIDNATTVDPDTEYAVQRAADHHVLEAARVRNFAAFVEEAAKLPTGSPEQGITLDKAGHLMYASHKSYRDNAFLGAPECDLLVALIRKREPAGLYGAKITGGGAGGTVALLAESSPAADAAIADILREYETQTGLCPEAFVGSSPGAWEAGTAVTR